MKVVRYIAMGALALKVFKNPSNTLNIEQRKDIKGLKRDKEIEQHLNADFNEMLIYLESRYPLTALVQRKSLDRLLSFYKEGWEPQYNPNVHISVFSRPAIAHHMCKGRSKSSAYHEIAHPLFNPISELNVEGDLIQKFKEDIEKLAQNAPFHKPASRGDIEFKLYVEKTTGCGSEIDYRPIQMLLEMVNRILSNPKYNDKHLKSAHRKGTLLEVKSASHLKSFEVIPTLIEFFTPAIFSNKGEALLKLYFPKTYRSILALMDKNEKVLTVNSKKHEL
ncbi:hypothetical protein CL658_03995 [bacterium]|nr:hypothetical protein [bacterium]|tara:strand:+ start:3091 stop:3924 length:834 start_codon:yes stop_codon:yes gene_type:complete